MPQHVAVPEPADGDKAVRQGGLPAGSVSMLNFLGIQPIVDGLVNIPLIGPVTILSNHPGAYDSISIASLIPHMDVKIIVMKIRFNKLYRISIPS